MTEWKYVDEKDRITREESPAVRAERDGSFIRIFCNDDSGLTVVAYTRDGTFGKKSPFTVKWCFDGNKELEVTDEGNLYPKLTVTVYEPESVELARSLAAAKKVKIICTDDIGNVKELEFHSLTHGERINTVLRACEHEGQDS